MTNPTIGAAVNFRPAIDDNLRSGTKVLAGTVSAINERDGLTLVDVSLPSGDTRCDVLFVAAIDDDNGAYVTSQNVDPAALQLAADEAAAAALAKKIADEKAVV